MYEATNTFQKCYHIIVWHDYISIFLKTDRICKTYSLEMKQKIACL